eukprot:scpid79454/ scgid11393/ Kinase D-interacting substrate of 220 kDa; Ankyrin repeat-rich membrane-spanning protein
MSELHAAAYDGNAELIQDHLKGLPDLDERDLDSGGHTALHWTAINKHGECTSLLLDAGADPNAKLFGGYTPLHCAAESGALSVIRMLLNKGALADTADKYGDTPKRVAERFGHKECYECIAKAIAKAKQKQAASEANKQQQQQQQRISTDEASRSTSPDSRPASDQGSRSNLSASKSGRTSLGTASKTKVSAKPATGQKQQKPSQTSSKSSTSSKATPDSKTPVKAPAARTTPSKKTKPKAAAQTPESETVKAKNSPSQPSPSLPADNTRSPQANETDKGSPPENFPDSSATPAENTLIAPMKPSPQAQASPQPMASGLPGKTKRLLPSPLAKTTKPPSPVKTDGKPVVLSAESSTDSYQASELLISDRAQAGQKEAIRTATQPSRLTTATNTRSPQHAQGGQVSPRNVPHGSALPPVASTKPRTKRGAPTANVLTQSSSVAKSANQLPANKGNTGGNPSSSTSSKMAAKSTRQTPQKNSNTSGKSLPKVRVTDSKQVGKLSSSPNSKSPVSHSGMPSAGGGRQGLESEENEWAEYDSDDDMKPFPIFSCLADMVELEKTRPVSSDLDADESYM